MVAYSLEITACLCLSSSIKCLLNANSKIVFIPLILIETQSHRCISRLYDRFKMIELRLISYKPKVTQLVCFLEYDLNRDVSIAKVTVTDLFIPLSSPTELHTPVCVYTGHIFVLNEWVNFVIEIQSSKLNL